MDVKSTKVTRQVTQLVEANQMQVTVASGHAAEAILKYVEKVLRKKLPDDAVVDIGPVKVSWYEPIQ